jgi:Membrane protein involved in the export of O-antigen and teichoic acid
MSPLLRFLPAKLRAKLGGKAPRALAMFFVTSIAARVIGIGSQLLQVPVVVKTLGAEAFGLWMTFVTLASLVLFADLGLGLGVQNRLAELFAHDTRRDRARARALFASAFLFLCIVGLLLAAGFHFANHHLDHARLFDLKEPAVVAAAPLAALITALSLCAGFPLGLGQRLAYARQQGWACNVAQAAGGLLSLVMVALACHLRWGLVGVVLAGQGSLFLANFCLLATQLFQLRWLSVWRYRLRPRLIRQLVGLGACFGAQQVLNTVLYILPQIVISTQLGAAAVTPFNLLQRLFNLFNVVQNAFMLPLWPAYSRARARGEFDWIRLTLRRSVLATVAFSIAPMLVGAVCAPLVIRLWVGHDVDGLTRTLVVVLFTWNAIALIQQPYSFLLAGVSEIRRLTVYSLLSGALSLALMFAFVQPLGAAGVALGLVLGFLPFGFLGAIVETRRYLRAPARSPAPAAPDTALPSASHSAPAAATS